MGGPATSQTSSSPHQNNARRPPIFNGLTTICFSVHTVYCLGGACLSCRALRVHVVSLFLITLQSMGWQKNPVQRRNERNDTHSCLPTVLWRRGRQGRQAGRGLYLPSTVGRFSSGPGERRGWTPCRRHRGFCSVLLCTLFCCLEKVVRSSTRHGRATIGGRTGEGQQARPTHGFSLGQESMNLLHRGHENQDNTKKR